MEQPTYSGAQSPARSAGHVLRIAKAVRPLGLACTLASAFLNVVAAAQSSVPMPATSALPPTAAVPVKFAGDDMPLTAPEVTYEDGQLTINASNSTLGDILNAVRSVMGADIDAPPKASREKMAAKLGPGPAREVLSSLLSWTDYNYLIQASDSDPNGIQSILLTARSKSPGSVPTRTGREQAFGASPHTALQPNARIKEEAASDDSGEEQALDSRKALSGAGVEPAPGAAPLSPASPAAASASTAGSQPAPADSQDPPAEIAQSSKADSGDDHAPKNSERMMQLQSLYEQRKQMIEDTRKSTSQN